MICAFNLDANIPSPLSGVPLVKRLLILAAVLASSAACASGPKGPEGGPPGEGPMAGGPGGGAMQRGEVLLAAARDVRTKEGCSAAAPSYRVVAGMGAGYEAAQDELGECLLVMTGANETETSLFREEAAFWLKRAAYAGNARAQRALSIFYGTADNPSASPVEALKWAIVYEGNSDSALYGFQALPPTFTPGLRAAMTHEQAAAAEKFAADFTPISLAAFTPPKEERGKRQRQGGPQGGPPPGGQRRRPQ